MAAASSIACPPWGGAALVPWPASLGTAAAHLNQGVQESAPSRPSPPPWRSCPHQKGRFPLTGPCSVIHIPNSTIRSTPAPFRHWSTAHCLVEPRNSSQLRYNPRQRLLLAFATYPFKAVTHTCLSWVQCSRLSKYPTEFGGAAAAWSALGWSQVYVGCGLQKSSFWQNWAHGVYTRVCWNLEPVRHSDTHKRYAKCLRLLGKQFF